jgi:hypothetical protein
MSPAKKRKRTSLPNTPNRAQKIAAAALHTVPAVSFSIAAPATTSAAASSTTAAPSNAAPAAEEPDSDDEQYYPAQALPASAKKPSRAFTALALLPSVRAAEPRNQKTLDLLRPSNREAYLVQCVGALSAPPCKPCSKGLGPWKQCCIVTDFLKGSCANCHYSGEGKRCSLRPGKLFHFPSFYISDLRMEFGFFESEIIFLSAKLSQMRNDIREVKNNNQFLSSP